MKYRIYILDDAKTDLKEIRRYLSDYGTVPKQKIKESFNTLIKNLADNPFIYSVYDDNQKYRKAVIEYGYLVFYTVENKIVRIQRVLNDRQNVIRIIE
ncbi:MAG: type II toxin-antitoxin system RelE/ParE family toxin [Oscillospiraceae bacterium]|nr:type II toxin-antitoxin system RelE/ParE family toxin [Oscillospiraceae bacterium]